jgi:inner membrane protein
MEQDMQKSLFLKSLTIGILMLLIAIPLMMIEGTISSRMRFRDEAVRSIAADSVGEQTLLGPVLIIPYSEHYEEEEIVDANANNKRSVIRQRVLNKRLFVFPNDLQILSNVDNDQRYRGIHKVLVYSGQHTLSGNFDLPTQDALVRDNAGSQLKIGQPFISLGLSDTRGLKNVPKIMWDGAAYEFQQDSKLTFFKRGLHAPLVAMDLKQGKTVDFNLKLSIDGIEQLAFIPIAKNNVVTMTSKWPHPQFFGRFLPSPKERKIDANGFTATWNISSLSSNAQQQLLNTECCHNGAPPNQAGAVEGAAQAVGQIDSFGVTFIEPVNIYSQSDRAIKYGVLFVALTFAAFFLFEILKQLPIHPVQYALVGLALVLFFLLLVSLSEHMRFITAYAIASVACISLIGFYLSYALRSWKRGFGFGAALSLLYGVLFGLLQSENNALVMGSLLLFSVLAAIMLVTRKVDWYQIGKSSAS